MSEHHDGTPPPSGPHFDPPPEWVRQQEREEARGEYREALERNERFDLTEPKRLPEGEAKRVRKAVEDLR